MVAELTLTLGQRWADHYLSGMMLLHILLGHSPAITPKAPPTPETLLDALQDVAAGVYSPDKYFKPGPASWPPLVSAPPPLAPGGRYALVGLNASTTGGQFVSVRTGGVAFEDPLWAIFAAHAAAKKFRVGLPLARDNEDLWRRTVVVAEAVRQGNYKPGDFLAVTDGYIAPEDAPKFTLLSVETVQIEALRARGLQSLKVPTPKFYELFQPPAGAAHERK